MGWGDVWQGAGGRGEGRGGGGGQEKTLRVWSPFLCVHFLRPDLPFPTWGMSEGRGQKGPQAVLLLGSKGGVTSSLSPPSNHQWPCQVVGEGGRQPSVTSTGPFPLIRYNCTFSLEAKLCEDSFKHPQAEVPTLQRHSGDSSPPASQQGRGAAPSSAPGPHLPSETPPPPARDARPHPRSTWTSKSSPEAGSWPGDGSGRRGSETRSWSGPRAANSWETFLAGEAAATSPAPAPAPACGSCAPELRAPVRARPLRQRALGRAVTWPGRRPYQGSRKRRRPRSRLPAQPSASAPGAGRPAGRGASGLGSPAAAPGRSVSTGCLPCPTPPTPLRGVPPESGPLPPLLGTEGDRGRATGPLFLPWFPHLYTELRRPVLE